MTRWKPHFGPETLARQAREQAFDAPAQVEVVPGIWLDSRLALINPQEGWLAVSDLHYGYELSLQKTGFLFPDYGRAGMETRLESLLADHQPHMLIFTGDMVHDYYGIEGFLGWLETLRTRVTEIVLICGNHDRYLEQRLGGLAQSHQSGVHLFHHGHDEAWAGLGEIEITGHWHPAVSLRDGAGLNVRAPAFLREPRPHGGERWVLPAFSPWTGGTFYPRVPGDQVWMCAPRRILPV